VNVDLDPNATPVVGVDAATMAVIDQLTADADVRHPGLTAWLVAASRSSRRRGHLPGATSRVPRTRMDAGAQDASPAAG
jgi:hypothetical protein